MVRLARLLALACCFAWADSAVHAAAPPQPGTALEALASPPHSLIRQRAQHFYKMPDGTIWDGYYAQEFRRIIDRNLRQYERRERGQPAPGAMIVEDRPAGIYWKFRDVRDTQAWGIFLSLADEDGELRWPYAAGPRRDGDRPLLETADRRRWKDVPPLWSSRQADDFTWSFALIDENNPDTYTRRTHGSYLRITRIWGDGQYEIEGYSLDLGRIEGMVTVPEPGRNIRRDQFRGLFFLWPEGTVQQPGGYARQAWRYIPADDLRLTPEQLAAALIDSRAEIIDWTYQRLSGRHIWQRSIRAVEFAPVRIVPRDRPADVPPPKVGDEGPDLIMLKDGRWYRGRLVRQDDQTIIFATRIGEMESELTFSADEVQEVQSPEKRGP